MKDLGEWLASGDKTADELLDAWNAGPVAGGDGAGGRGGKPSPDLSSTGMFYRSIS